MPRIKKIDVSLDDKLKIIEEYKMKNPNKVIYKNTKYKNYPIGEWIIFINTFSNENKSFLTDYQIKKIEELGETLIYLRNQTSLNQKIEIFQKYQSENEEKINGNTIYEGYPIGKWANTVRYYIASGRLTPKEDQLIKLTELGILEPKIDSTIDEKIDELIKWTQKYPDIKVKSRYASDFAINSVYEKLEEIANKENVCIDDLIKKYKKIQSYYEYVRIRYGRGKLSKEQIEKCQNGKIGRIFGYSKEIKELALALNCDESLIDEILIKYTSIDNLKKLYFSGKLSKEEIVKYRLESIFNTYIDIDFNPNYKNYIKLIQQIFNEEKKDNNLKIFSSKKINEAIEKLSDKRQNIIIAHYGLDDGNCKTYKSIESRFNLSLSRLNQLEEDGLECIRNYDFIDELKPINLDELIENYYTNEDDKRILINLKNDLLNSNLIFVNNEQKEFNLEKLYSVVDIKNNVNNKLKELENKVSKNKIESIFDVGLSYKAASVLFNAGIIDSYKLRQLNYYDIAKIKKMSGKTRKEIILFLEKKYELYLNEKGKFVSQTSNYELTELEQLEERKKKISENYRKLKDKAEKSRQLLVEYEELIIDQNIK